MTISNNLLPDHFREFVASLNEFHVEYLIIGGYALGAYGHLRGTNDLDIFIHATDENANKMISACSAYGIPKDTLSNEMFLVQKMIGIGDPPLRIEIIKDVGSIDFSYAYQRKRQKMVDGVMLNVIGIDDLILLKKNALRDRNSSRDQEDLNYLESLKNKS